MPGRKFSSTTNYRYGFNGKEEDDEVKGDGNQQDYGMRIYDPRLGRFLSVDPITKDYPGLTPYQFASNTPIQAVDFDGLEAERRIGGDAVDMYMIFRQKGKSHEEALGASNSWAAGRALGVFIGADWATGANVTKLAGSVLIIWQASEVFEYTNRNSHQTDPKIRAENSRKAKEALGGLAITYGVGVIGSRFIGGAIKFFSGPKQEEVNFLFRGTSEGFNGSNANQVLQVTPTSSDPVVATIFALNSKNYGKGILQIVLPKELQGVQYTGNVLESLEKEIAVGMAPVQFTAKASITITADQAVGILKNMGITLPKNVRLENLSEVIRNTPRLTPSQIQEFYKQASQIKTP